MGRGRRSTGTARLGSGPQPAAASPTRPRTSPRPSRGGRAAAYRLLRGFPDASSSSCLPRPPGPNPAATVAPTQRGGQGPARRATSLAPRLKQFNRVPGRVVEQDLRAARSGHDVVAEMDPGGAESIYLGREVLNDEVDTVPA